MKEEALFFIAFMMYIIPLFGLPCLLAYITSKPFYTAFIGGRYDINDR